MCAVCLCAVSLAGCSRETPTGPTQPGPPSNLPPTSSVLGISVIGDMWIPTTSTSVQMTARLITSTTPFDYVMATDGVAWSIEPAGVATIDQRGRVTPIANGSATVTARYGDKSGINPIRVLPDYSGHWTGEFVVTSCSGGFDPRECGRIINGLVGTGDRARYPFTLMLSQERR